MGLLDDAIREHLDLKRRRGADPAEVERAEREALGPVRRNRDASPAAESDEDLTAVGGAYDQSDEDWDYDDRLAVDEDLPPLEFAADERPPHGEPADEEEFADEDEPFGEPAPVQGHAGIGDATQQFDVEDALSQDEEGEDMLEETPEFLQDTPDHDRLWFEQRPPRDFDFDG